MRVIFKGAPSAGTPDTLKVAAAVAKEITARMREAGKKAAAAANQQIRGAGFASAKWEMAPKYFPPSGDSLTPEVWLHSRSNFEQVFTEGRAITGPSLLWLPLPGVPLWPGDPTRQMSPKKYLQSVGPLTMIKRVGKVPLLMAPVFGLSGPQSFIRPASLRKLRRQIGTGKRSLVPMFVGVPGVVIEKKFDVEGAIEKAVEDMPEILVIDETV